MKKSMDLREEIKTVLASASLMEGRLLVALSGGLDSSTLLRLLAEIEGPVLEAAHLDHNLRASSAEDAEFCQNISSELGIPLHLKTLEKWELAGNVQSEARKARRLFFSDLLKERGFNAILLAHHADDQIETLLFRFLRGAGPRGITGMNIWEPPYLRPLLGVRRSDIEGYAVKRGWSHREDPTNATGKYSRNRIRHELLPLAREVCPGADDAILRFAALAKRDEEFLTELSLELYQRIKTNSPEGISIEVAALKDAPQPLRSRVLLAAFRDGGGDTSLISLDHLNEAEKLLNDGRPHRIAPLPGEVKIVRSYERLWVLATPLERPTDPPPVELVELEEAYGEEGESLFKLPFLKSDEGITFRYLVRGDRLGTRKVKDILISRRIHRWCRPWTIVCEGPEGPLAIIAPGEPPAFATIKDKEASEAPFRYARVSEKWWKKTR
ncbi:MAG: tRNA lysidine(34) synthetase TilS [Deltaproteobacteria bacterium]|nr:MAG: tRNA lysidine(34) synthetase TilS [Deltaproteobacteria bacterium]